MLKIRWDTHIPDYPVIEREYDDFNSLEEAAEKVAYTNNHWSVIDSHYIGEAIWVDENGKETVIYEY